MGEVAENVACVHMLSSPIQFLQSMSLCVYQQVDVLFPASPYFLWTASNILELLLKPVLEYSINDTEKYGLYIPYNLNWAPHHLGKWPSASIAWCYMYNYYRLKAAAWFTSL